MIIEVKVITKSSQNKVVGFEGKVLKIKCTVAPEKGQANDLVIELLSDYYHVSKRKISIIQGKTSSKKRIKIEKD